MKGLLSILFVLFGMHAYCQNKSDSLANGNEKILEIDYDFGGGRFTDNVLLKISQDSTSCKAERGYNPQIGRYKNYFTRTKKTDRKVWNSLISAINLSSFDTIKKVRSVREIDGGDTEISIKTSKKIHYYTIVGYPNKVLNDFLAEINIALKDFD
jgi:hypothetical protein